MTAPDATTGRPPSRPASRPALPPSAGPGLEAQLERLADDIGERVSAAVAYGEPVTAGGVTVIPVAEVSVGFGVGIGSGPSAGVGDGEGVGGGGAITRPRGFIEIKDGTATYRPLRRPWLLVALPLAALLTGAAVPPLARRLARHRRG
ncbi:spore germination protein GerW family protein [Streptomyces sp. 71268]|uniref:GerW family sporulation protein n=1 Tax=Streptomyces sp. 71268 TaxID=3002640 RepID=UPI0023F74FC3|nr:spore germination protein GerW family protein [Streptomyces sp. 71268]WEV25643.1 spore germination protein GerW family protein [Streptomyces sp. 71268]